MHAERARNRCHLYVIQFVNYAISVANTESTNFAETQWFLIQNDNANNMIDRIEWENGREHFISLNINLQ